MRVGDMSGYRELLYEVGVGQVDGFPGVSTRKETRG